MKIAFFSDSHCQRPKLPDADLLVHCGDLTGSGTLNAFAQEVKWLASLRDRYRLGILYVPGNHDKGLDPDLAKKAWEYWAKDPYHRYPPPKTKTNEREQIQALFRDARIDLVIDEAREIEGVKFYGSPMTPRFMHWNFMDSDAALGAYWNKIPEDTQVLITHGPAYGLRDLCSNGHVGSQTLYDRIKNGLPDLKVHAFGHIHEGAGFEQVGRYLCLNASVLDGFYNGFNDIYVVDTDTWSVCETFEDPYP